MSSASRWDTLPRTPASTAERVAEWAAKKAAQAEDDAAAARRAPRWAARKRSAVEAGVRG